MATLGGELRELFNLISRTRRGCGREANKSTMVQGMVLSYIISQGSGDVFQRDIEENFKIRRPTATKLLQGLEKRGMILREPVPHDLRLKKLVPTELAAREDEAVRERIREFEERMCAGITDGEAECFVRVVGKMKANLRGK